MRHCIVLTYVAEGTKCKRGHVNPVRYSKSKHCVECVEIGRTRVKSKFLGARGAAYSRGEVFYECSIPCRFGHGVVRYVGNGSCPTCLSFVAKSAASTQKQNEIRKQRYQDNPQFREIMLHRAKTYRELNAEALRVKQKQRYYEDPITFKVRATIRKKRARQATPTWLTTRQLQEIRNFYERAASLTKVTCIPHEVDHIVPLQARTVCGLNVPWNLQVLTAEENRRKRDGLPGAGELLCRTAKAYRGRLVRSY
jgi:5-methylcytosine-specific restriction endonuclease McrA